MFGKKPIVKITRPFTLSDLRQELIQTMIDLKKGKISLAEAKEINKLAGNAIDTAKVQIAAEFVKPHQIPHIT